jgi:TPR repeat protein
MAIAYKLFAHCSKLSDLVPELVPARVLDPFALFHALQSFRNEELAEAVLQRHPLVRAAGALVCTGTAESKHAWCSMLRDLFDAYAQASRARVSDDDCLKIYLLCLKSANRKLVLSSMPVLQQNPFIKSFNKHPALPMACPELAFVAEFMAHPFYCLASRSSVQRWKAMFRCRSPSQARAQQWHVYDIDVGLQQRSTLLARAASCELLVLRLMRFGGAYGVRHPQHHATCVVSRRHFLVSKNLAQCLFDEGQRLYGSQRFGDAARSFAQAALLKHAHAHALLSGMLLEHWKDVPYDVDRAFELASAGASMGCAHSKGALGLCYSMGGGVDKWAPESNISYRTKAFALGRESAAAGSCIGQFVVGREFYYGKVVAKDTEEAARWWRLSAEQGYVVAQDELASVAQDQAEAVRWRRLAAEQGYASAQFDLGFNLYHGWGVAVDKAEAVRWWRLAADGATGSLKMSAENVLKTLGT